MCGHFRSLLLAAVLVLGMLSPSMSMGERIKDVVSIEGVRANQLFGYGLVIGLNGTGDKGGTSFTIQALANMLEHMGIHVSPQDLKVTNVAAVMVSASLPPFARVGKKIDVTVSSIGDAKTLQGGTLLLTPLKGVDGKIYALAQGPLSLGGFRAGGAAGGGVTKNHPTVARISAGAIVEKEVPFSLNDKKELTFILDNPDFVTAARVAEAINSKFRQQLAMPLDSGTLRVKVPALFRGNVVNLLAELGDLEVVPDSIAKVVVSEKTGTVVMGENVRVSTVAIAHGNLHIQIKETQNVSQPSSFAPRPPAGGALAAQTEGGTIIAPGGSTVVTPESSVAVEEENRRLLLIPKGNTIGELIKALNAIGVTPRDLIAILQAIKAAGALQAKLEII
ncbi:MAG: flagellar basal body P-ring protein FlgI [Deltaproteobacteria bacterium]|nr:flagellar basal body P-ring protein FlgI [Deltaproteobacteria bacterium]MBW1918619.1 flagellar basal body P-ring protein FlgI [Deltaproteobacteria bacterium]MBW1934059.1 flagellar basal body P-ring protein FlgI [Deltaproteobacteria bacterium]MBW1976369.1 flagellar basal body P-ring protein FlgI [Deltaproteobacteria bacterium]MBW2043353.1 flagellar basal body P-ring protein FlgI [Deltaproteobacteria bacterium]